MSEWMLRDLAAVTDMRYVALRYFNVAGSDPQCRIGQATPRATLLIKVACEAMVGKRSDISIYAPTTRHQTAPECATTCTSTTSHAAHLMALDYLRSGGRATVLNCGYGHGYSVRQVLDSVQRIGGRSLRIHEQPRRAGDPGMLIAPRGPYPQRARLEA